jgi:hypothetical protein
MGRILLWSMDIRKANDRDLCLEDVTTGEIPFQNWLMHCLIPNSYMAFGQEVVDRPYHVPVGEFGPQSTKIQPQPIPRATELKFILAHILLAYEVKLENDGVCPPNE